jgi:pyruvate formate lyase activating enzyme
MGCNLCRSACPQSGIDFDENGIVIDRQNCLACSGCADVCPMLALEMKGRDWDLDDLVYEALKDRNYFGDEGGVTVSGGECLLQADFVAAFLGKLKQEGIHTALDTAGCVSEGTLAKALPYTDLVLYDIKLYDEELHKIYTGVGNSQILKNARYLVNYSNANDGKPEIWIRTPVIPGITDMPENIEYIAKYIHEYLEPGISRWELLAFNNLCRDKYGRLDMQWGLGQEELLTEAKMEHLKEVALKKGVNPAVVRWSGSTKSEEIGPAAEGSRP